MEEKDVREKLEGNTNNYKKLKCTLTTLVAVAIVNMCVLLPLVIHWHLLSQNRVESEWFTALDVTSQGNPDLLGQLIIKTDKNTDRNTTCGKLNILLKTVVDQNIHDSYDSDACPEPEGHGLDIKAFNCSVSKQVKSTLHLDNFLSHAKPVIGENTKLFWSHVTYMTLHMKYIQDEGVIYIKKYGYYFVESLLTVRVNYMISSNDTVTGFGDTIRHVVNVIQQNDRTERVLLENVKTTCVLSFDHAEWSSDIGAPFYLNEQERVYMATSHPYNILSGHGKNYLSIHTIL